MKFDAAYYNRFYENPATRAASAEEQAVLANFVSAYLEYLDVNVTSILDLGCGLGELLHGLHQAFPNARATGVDISEYLCKRYGWQLGSVVDFTGDAHDFVICSDVLGYLSDRECAKAIQNLANLCNTALYLSVLTEEDLDICDAEHTDMQQIARPYNWYKTRLNKHFVAVGGGLFLRKPLRATVWRLERS